ncbi:hypothetical protein ES705_21037 [subsurface metagenome]
MGKIMASKRFETFLSSSVSLEHYFIVKIESKGPMSLRKVLLRDYVYVGKM